MTFDIAAFQVVSSVAVAASRSAEEMPASDASALPPAIGSTALGVAVRSAAFVLSPERIGVVNPLLTREARSAVRTEFSAGHAMP